MSSIHFAKLNQNALERLTHDEFEPTFSIQNISAVETLHGDASQPYCKFIDNMSSIVFSLIGCSECG